MPERIQLKRAKGWRMPPNTVKVDRSTRWGNPYKVGDEGVPDAAAAVLKFEKVALLRNTETHSRLEAAVHDLILNRILGLKGKNLACWCKPGTPCHADVLLKIANPT